MGRSPEPSAHPKLAPEHTKVCYPSLNCKPMPDNTWQLRTVYRQYGALSIRYEGDPSTFIGIDLLLYDREDKRGQAVAPDLFVVFGTPD